MKKENTVAVIYSCKGSSEKITQNRQKLTRRIERAVEDMAEDGFTNFILPLDERSLFPSIAIEAIKCVQSQNPNIRLILVLPYEMEEGFDLGSAERLRHLCEYADQIIYNQKDYICSEPTNQAEKLLAQSSALIIYFENNCSQLHSITHHAQRNRLPLININ